jgi:RNA polymerase sigma factor (sigma-70 family)
MNTLSVMPTAEPVRGASPAQIEAVYRDRFDQLLRVCRAITGSDEAAYDAVQDGVARALRSREQFSGRGSLEGWIWRAVVNAARNQRRVRTLVAVGPEPAAQLQEEHHGLPRELIAELPDRQRMVLFLRYFADMSYEKIAETLEISPGTVGATLNAAHATLRQRLEEAGR